MAILVVSGRLYALRNAARSVPRWQSDLAGCPKVGCGDQTPGWRDAERISFHEPAHSRHGSDLESPGSRGRPDRAGACGSEHERLDHERAWFRSFGYDEERMALT